MSKSTLNIKEVEPDKKLVLSKFNFSCDDIDESIPKPLPQMLNFFMLICGRPGSGKTTLILNLIAKRGKMYNKKFDKIFVFSPSLMTMKENPFEELPDNQVDTELTEENLTSALEEIKDSGEKILFILDDVVNDIKRSSVVQNTLSRMLMNRRHLAGAGGSTSFIITTQVYNKIPAPIRKTASHIIIFHTKNKKELDTIFDELIIIPQKDFYAILKFCFDKKNHFLYIDTNKSYDRMFHKNFNNLEFNASNDSGLSDL
jgi:AAA+ ATPase superfamily predicted ATPase